MYLQLFLHVDQYMFFFIADVHNFWKWTSFSYYIFFTLIFSFIVGIVTFSLLRVHIFVELLGFASLLTEALLGIPQFWKNFKNTSTEGMRSDHYFEMQFQLLHFVFSIACKWFCSGQVVTRSKQCTSFCGNHRCSFGCADYCKCQWTFPFYYKSLCTVKNDKE